MSAQRGLQVQIPRARMEGDGLGLRSVTFEVQVSESSTTHTVELDDNAITFLHEELLKHSGDAPRIQGQKWRLFESERFVEERRRSYENYLNDVVLSPSCVDKGIVWVTLGVDSASATTHRFLIRGDNIQQLEELSLIDPERLLTTGVLSVLSRLVQDRANDLTVVSSAVTVLLRVLSRPGTSKLITETSVVPSLLRCLFQTSTPLIIQLIADTCVRLITAHPQSLFWYFQRDSGLTELIDIIDTCKACPHAIQGLSEIVWVGITQSRDIELAVTDKSSVGMSLLNKLLVKGEGTESELVVTCTLAYLFVRGQVAEFSDKINHIISSYMSGDLAHSYRLNFVENMPRFLYLLGKPESPVLPENEQVIQLGCHVIVSKCLIDPTFFDRTLVRPPLTRRLRQIVFTGSEVDEKTRSRCAEALVVLGGPDLGSPENLTNTLEMEKFIYTLNAKLIGDKIHKLNNFFIEANFDLSSRVVTDTIGNDHTAAVLHYAEEIDDMVKSIDAEQTQLQVIHTKALNEVVSGMFQLKSMQKEIESVTTTDLSTEPGVQQLEDYAKELKKLESIPDPSPEVLTKARELKVEIVDSAPAREVMAKRSAILKTIRNVNVQVMNLDSETFASLVEAVKQIENRSESSHRQIAQLKVLLVKIKHQVDDLLEQIDADTASSPVSPYKTFSGFEGFIHYQLMIEIFLVVAMLVVVVVGFLMGLRPFFTPKLMVLVTGVTAVLTSVPHIVWTQDSPDLTSAATYMSVSFFVSSMLWDSRSFLIDNFCFKFILYRPAYLIVPVMLILQLSAVVDLDVSVGLVVVQVLLGALVSETTYSVAKRNDLILRTYRRRGSLPRMQTMPTTPQLPV